MEVALALPAPAKLNLFLHVVGRRPDGYHELQTAYALIDLADWLDFERRTDGAIVREGDLIGSVQDDLAMRAARALQQACGTPLGATITVTKCIPHGSGMGGGSSDAATTLIALNRLWDLKLERSQLSTIGLQLGADVPFFLHGRNALGEGIGERLRTIELPRHWYAIVWPQVHVSTKGIFADYGLTPHSKVTKILPFSAAAGADADRCAGASKFTFPPSAINDLESVARRRYPVIDQAIKWLERDAESAGAARMTGSGSAVFMVTDSKEQALAAVADLPAAWRSWVVQGVDEHPLSVW